MIQPEIEPGQEVEIDLFRNQDAPGVAACLRAVYGEGYPVKVYYNPPELIAAVERGQIISVVARTPRGEVVGVENLFNSAPFKGIYEIGAGLVLPAYRQRGINTALIRFMLDTAIPLKKIPMGFGEPVCNHTTMQRSQEAMGYITSALEVDLMPAAAYAQEKSASGRVAALMAFRSYQPHQGSVHLPPRYAQALRQIYAGLGLERTFIQADPQAQLPGATEFKVEVFDFAQVARVAVLATGADLEARLDALLAELQGQGVQVAQAWLNLGSPLVAAAAEVLRSRGFFLGGPLPRWFDDDGLFLQRVAGQPHWEGIKVLPGRNQLILDLVRRDWRELNPG